MENKAEYIAEPSLEDDLKDAKEMMGKGYPTVKIEPPRSVMERREGEFEEIKHPAWIKFSTAFKAELKDIHPNALKVWIYIALSVNYNGVAFPGIRTIAEYVGVSTPTVVKAIKDTRIFGLIEVARLEWASLIICA